MTYRNPSRASWAATVTRLKETFEKWGVGPEDYHIETEAPVGRRELVWYSEEERRVLVTYRPPSAANVVRMELATQDTPPKNLSSIAITIEGIRMQERRGLSGIAAAHYLALNAPVTARDPYEVLGLRPGASAALIEAAYRTLAKDQHPDHAGGSNGAMAELNEARDLALEQVSS